MATEAYRCLACGHEFRAPPGPVELGPRDGACPRCDHLYIEWLTYEQNFVKKKGQ